MSDNMFRQYQEAVKKMDDAELARWTGGWRPGSDPFVAGQMEIQRRSEEKHSRREDTVALRAWIAIGISTAALAVSILALVLKLK
ncbi:MAG: hypothetical protein MUF81_13000 [Verrucomicrobia bacterium]|jgi:hypothetical protein|nr:hypothetical protein [Verrucomicrobiota bacterium]